MGDAVMRRGWPLVLMVVAALLAITGWYELPGAQPRPAIRTAAAPSGFANLPLAFEPNRGQSDPRVRFQSRTAGFSLYLTANQAVIGMRGSDHPLWLAWRHANPDPAAAGVEPLPAKHHYLKGRDPAAWHRNIPTYAQVRYTNLYPGIDLVYYGRDRQLEYDLVVAPGADPQPIEFALTGMDGLRVDRDGDLQVRLGQQAISLRRPIIYQDTRHGRQVVDGGYVRLAHNAIGLRLGAYDKTRPLIIDPMLSFSTYLGGSGAELGRGVAVDANGNVYMVGQTTSQDIRFSNGNKASSDTDVLLAKFDSTGTLQGVMYLGGSGTDRGFGVVADNGSVYIVGDTTSADFPVQNAQQAQFGGDTDAVVAKLDSDLNLVFSTYMGGSNIEEGLGIALDTSVVPSNIYITGSTLSNNLPGAPANTFNTTQCQDPAQPNAAIPCSDAYVVKYDNNGVRLWAVYVGGSEQDAATAIAADAAGNSYITGITYSPFPTFPGISSSSSYQYIPGSLGDAFIAALDPSGAVQYATYVGGTGFDQGQSIAVGSDGYVYVGGITNSASLPVVNAAQAEYSGGGMDGFVIKMKPVANATPAYFTYLGGGSGGQTGINAAENQISGIAIDGAGEAFVVGETMSPDFPTLSPLQSVWFGGGVNRWGDAFATKFGADGSLLWSTYLGGSDDDWADGIATDGNGNLFVAGSTFSSNFPISAGAAQVNNKGGGDAFLFKLVDNAALAADLQVSVDGTPDLAGTGDTVTYTVAVENLSTVNSADGVLLRATLPPGLSYQAATPANSCTVSGTQQLDCLVGTVAAGGRAVTTIKAANNTAGDITFTATVVRSFEPDPDVSNNTGSVTTKAALGKTGGGAWSPLEAMVLLAYGIGRRRCRRRC